ncbi:hypothetical protein CTAM01_03963 [Colletotrichum tamarilloi]|uniref:Uncharacterized protein n=1 Tax=Colletotrichum tamarilloi TaxID=1209934 RepID=A0ABQ9RJ15_9PEZI|nr:uncharacterized protein CTAM01_03963 [Colletotrichum tamarilloi]KAK1504656.1 hypothetical protein CTAM01_03963 [Colletotrichum tamarilloi]
MPLLNCRCQSFSPIAIFRLSECRLMKVGAYGTPGHNLSTSRSLLPLNAKNLGVFVFSLVAESYVGILAVSVLFAETFALAVRRVDLRQIGTVCTIDRMPVLGCLPSEPEIAAVNASCTGFRRCLQLCVLKGNAPAFSLTCVAGFSKVHGTLLSGFCIASGGRIFLLASRRSRVMSEDTTIAMSLAHRRRGEKGKRSMGCRRAGLRFTGFPGWRDCGVSGGGGGGGENGKSADVSEVDLLVLISPRPKSLTLPANWVQ